MRNVMLMARHKRMFTAIFFVAALARTGQADQLQSSPRSRAESRARLLAPFVDDQTFAVMRVDISQIAGGELLEFVKQFGLTVNRLPQPAPAARQLVEALKQAGARDVYVIASFADLPERPPFFIVPLEQDSNEEQLKSALAAFEIQERIGDVLLAGSQASCSRVSSQKTLRRLVEFQPKSRPELQRALEAAGDGQLQFVLMPSASTRRVVEELVPTLPASFGGGPTLSISRGVIWAALTLNGPPEIGARLVIQAQDAGAAATLRGLWRDVLVRALPEGAKISDKVTPELREDRLVLHLQRETIDAFFSSVVRPHVGAVTDFARRQQSTEHLKRIGLGMHLYADAHKRFPAAALTGRDGKPLLSWRVAILPYLEQEALYKEFHLDEPWDGPNNRKLVERMPDVYRSLGVAATENRTPYLVPVGKGSVFDGTASTGFADITDGTSNTIMVMEVGDEQAVIWTKPDDYSYDPKQPARGLTKPYANGRLIMFCDGSVHFITQTLDDELLRRLFGRSDGQVVPELH